MIDKTTLITIGIIIALIAGNVYQFQNPKVIEVPSGTEQIDSTAWVQRSALADAETIIDSLENQNKAMADRIEKQGDQIANYTSITGRLKLKVDSLQSQPWNAIPLTERMLARDYIATMDTTFHQSKTFGNGLFKVDGLVRIRLTPSEGLQFKQDFYIQQLRDIRLDVVHTLSDDNARSLVYVTSPDFSDLKYQSFTELKQKKRLPWFWIGLGTGVVGTIILL